jgi:hypothetical protein
VGLHGLYHEYLAGHTLDQQIAVIGQMKSRFGPSVAVSGANFLGRTDQDTVDAMIANGLRYFVAFMEHRYGPFAYRKMPLRPFLNWSPRGTVWMVPISVETYNKPWTAIRNMIDSARVAGRAQGWPHINILLHPFRDGSLRHIGDLAKIIKYLQDRLGYRATSLGRVPASSITSTTDASSRRVKSVFGKDGGVTPRATSSASTTFIRRWRQAVAGRRFAFACRPAERSTPSIRTCPKESRLRP